jgi:hypothetical protein
LPPPPTPANTKTQVVAYKNLFLQYELIRNEGRNNSYKSAEVREEMYTLYNELQDKFLDMEFEGRRQVKMVNFPYIRLEENGSIVFKAMDELSPEQRLFSGC